MDEGKSRERAISVLCVGGAVVDLTYAAHRRLRPATSNPVTGSRAFGGVARNVAVNLVRLGVATALASVMGDDQNGRALAEDLRGLGVSVDGLRIVPGARTAEYVALLEPNGGLAIGVADMAVFDALGAEDLSGALSQGPAWVFADCNCPAALLAGLIGEARSDRIRLAVDAVSTPKVERLPERPEGLDLLFLNLDEAAALLGRDAAGLDPVEAVGAIRGRGCGGVVLTLGVDGLVFASGGGEPEHLPALPTRVVDVTGAGDALIAGTLAGLVRGDALPDAVRLGLAAAALTLASAGSTTPRLRPERLASMLRSPRT